MLAQDFMLAALAEIGAIRNVFVHVVALRLVDEADPQQTLSHLDRKLCKTPTLPADMGGGLDPAMSDLLCALTDDRTQALVGDVGRRLDAILGRT